MIIPIFINCEDIEGVDLDGIGNYFLAYFFSWCGMVPLTYSIIGYLNGFDTWGLVGASIIIGNFAALLPLIIGQIWLD